MNLDELIKRIEICAGHMNRTPATICRLAVQNPTLYQNLKDGKGLHSSTYGTLDKWLDENSPAK